MDRYIKRFICNVVIKDSCWEWNAGKYTDGYGAFSYILNGQNKRVQEKTHRISYRIFKGDIPDGLCVLHTCDNRSCVNPDHLWLGTNRDNAIDCAKKGRTSNQKLTPVDVMILREAANMGFAHKEIARYFGIHKQHVSHIKCGVTRRYV